MKRKKQGASLIVVIIVFMFVSTVSMAMISMVAGNYKARVAESKRVENLYASDSGLDVAYNIIGKTFDAAAKYGYCEVEALKSTFGNIKSPNDVQYKNIKRDIDYLKGKITELNHKNDGKTDATKIPQSDIDKAIAEKNRLIEEDENLKKLLLNEEFKRGFKNFVATTTELGDGEAAPNKLQDSIEHHKYVVVSSDNTNTINFNEEIIDFGGIKNKNDNPPELKVENGSFEISGSSYTTKKIEKSDDEHHEDVSFNVYGDQEYRNITVTSTFYTEQVNTTNTNERQLKASYKMLVPNYTDVYFENSNGDVYKYLATNNRALTIYGDMNIDGANGLAVDGEIFVKGSDDHSSTDKVNGKYYGGITLNNSDSVSFTDNVITTGTFNIQDATKVTIDKNLYARNAYVGKIDGVQLANKSSLEVGEAADVLTDESRGQVIIDNDLALNSKDTKINIKDFYGINDINDINVNAARSSSSIIVNGNENSTINITNSAYIMGTAHIDTVGDYQTGESGAVKGNYIAYAYSVPSIPNETFVPYPPLQLLYQTDVMTKATHFKSYWEGQMPNNNPDTGGITWPHSNDGTIITNNIHSIGAIVYDVGGTKYVLGTNNYNVDLELTGKVAEKRIDFASKVYKFGQSANLNDYANQTLISFKTLIDTSKIPTEYLDTQKNKGEYAIFNGDKDAEIQILQSTTTDTEDKIDTKDPKVIKIYVANKGSVSGHTLNAVIATEGKVTIGDSDITINGCIIANGDLNINNKENVKIKYDSGVIERVQAQNSDTFKAVFGGSIIDQNTTVSSQTAGISDANYDLKNFLENKSWKILK